MFRLVSLASLGVLAVQPVFAQQVAPAQMTSGTKPGSSIALSPFALAQRDRARGTSSVSTPTLQVSVPAQSLPSASASATSPTQAQPKRTVVAPPLHPVSLPQPTATVAAPVPPPLVPVTNIVPQPVVKNSPASTSPKGSDASSKPVALPVSPAAQPKALASREAMRQRMLLSRLDADLGVVQLKLDRAHARLSQSQRQLGAFTSALSNAMMEAGDEGSGLHPFVRVAQRYLGTPYVWGGESARGFDCSGFIMRVMRDLGYRALPHSAAEQFHYGTPIARELLKPGDIVFFANTYKPGVSHVGIYLGRGRFIHAANSKVGTIVSSLNEAKWIAHYAGARRLVRARA